MPLKYEAPLRRCSAPQRLRMRGGWWGWNAPHEQGRTASLLLKGAISPCSLTHPHFPCLCIQGCGLHQSDEGGNAWLCNTEPEQALRAHEIGRASCRERV